MDLIVYYDAPQGIGSQALQHWVEALIGSQCTFKSLPNSNNSAAFTQLPAYVADILYLDKPDVIITAISGIHERPICSIELAGCTPQYQHAIQRFSRMLASAGNGCPSVVIMPRRKRENQGGPRFYSRSPAISYGAVRLMDIYNVPAFVLDWPDDDGMLEHEGSDPLPPLASEPMLMLSQFIAEAIRAFATLDFLGVLWKGSVTRRLLDATRRDAYGSGAPTIASPGGGGGAGGVANLDLISTTDLLTRMLQEGRASQEVIAQIPPHIRARHSSLLFYPTRLVKKAGDPYVGMMSYYDIAFCRDGSSSRDRTHNLVAYCNGVSIAEVTNAMRNFNNNSSNNGCPFVQDVDASNILRYAYHLRNGCAKTKTKPIRIYSELADIIVFSDGILVHS